MLLTLHRKMHPLVRSVLGLFIAFFVFTAATTCVAASVVCTKTVQKSCIDRQPPECVSLSAVDCQLEDSNTLQTNVFSFSPPVLSRLTIVPLSIIATPTQVNFRRLAIQIPPAPFNLKNIILLI
jgi:hypothetical protein